MEPVELSKTLISGTMPDTTMIFAPIPNFIFTRDIGITINDHILLNKPAKIARTREALLTQYVFYNHPMLRHLQDRIIEIPESEHHFLLPDGEKDYKRATLEGGDVMIVSKNHLVIGISERTSALRRKSGHPDPVRERRCIQGVGAQNSQETGLHAH
jgi:arginine deiminase